jgi:hypothetical protein
MVDGKLMANNLARINSASRRMIMRFLYMVRSRENTKRLRSKARMRAIVTADDLVGLDLNRAERDAAERNR